MQYPVLRPPAAFPIATSLIAFVAVLATAWLSACAQPSTANDTSTVQRLQAALQRHPIVLLGEVHDNAHQHALRAEALGALLAGGARPALLMEQFDRERQPDLDRVLARPDADVDAVIAAGTGGRNAASGWDWTLYRPYVALALRYRLPLVAANVSRDDTRRILRDGLAASGFDPAVPSDIEAAQADAIVAGHCGAIDAAGARRLVAAQVARDQYMARAIETHAARGAVLLAGNGHVRRDIGVARWLSAKVRERSVSIGLAEAGDPPGAAFDLTVTTAAHPRRDPCEGMRRAADPPQGVMR